MFARSLWKSSWELCNSGINLRREVCLLRALGWHMVTGPSMEDYQESFEKG